ncbi:tRNA (guanosine(46)-N7)-methyltransferase TrmB [Chondrinema litorale]|uniref:tRNA (guanosine(46)-N7)-methyltransferase TrmB n=1 Tax=Chondrinema litorale TaxID=2994555 RepID=UPI0025442BF6|nr:tRNA (guanosine(46)-N7)-methyltransferase TrmB [Chondrinema litorale]UZR94948.1 tRNA (guanosine(46)-N7)-methyltransferase TrmB [Chondrinema litorale]
MARQKKKRFEEIVERDIVIEPGKDVYREIKGKWREKVFKNNNGITLEIACGRGEYTTGLAAEFPNRNFIGIDVKGDRIWYGSSVAEENGLDNVAFLRTKVHDLELFFEENEVEEIWIVHPDPRPKTRDAKRRLTSQRFLDIYKSISKENALIRFKTDNYSLFEYSLEVIKRNGIKDLEYTFDLDQSSLKEDHFGIETRYEKIFKEKGCLINYLKFRFDNA